MRATVDDGPGAGRDARRPRRRRILRGCLVFFVAGVIALVLAWPALVDELGGASSFDEAVLEGQVSDEARSLAARAFDGLDVARLVDFHVHVAGIGTGGTECWVNPRMRSWRSPVQHARFQIYLSATGVTDLERADQQAAERFRELARGAGHAGRYFLLAFDHHYTAAGERSLEHSEFYVPNDYVFELVERREGFLACASVHPYRPDALEELERCAQRGARLVKWLPNAMGIDPSDERCGPFYAKMREHGMVLLSHAGEEKAVHAEDLQRLGNPLLLRAALDAGVRVVVAHCASLGTDRDLDHPERGDVSSFQLFLRMMDEPRYEGLLFGEISGLTQVNRLGEALATLLEREDLHARLVNGSDYPIPAVNCLIHLRPLEKAGYVTAEESRLLREVFDANPLLFDLVLKRTLRSPVTGRGFGPEAFLVPESWGL